MGIALLVFFLVLLILSVILYGLHEWDNLLADPDEISDDESAKPRRGNPWRFAPLWVLLVGLTGVSLLAEFIEWLRG